MKSLVRQHAQPLLGIFSLLIFAAPCVSQGGINADGELVFTQESLQILEKLGLEPSDLVKVHEDRLRLRQTKTGRCYSIGQTGYIEFDADMKKLIRYISDNLSASGNWISETAAKKIIDSLSEFLPGEANGPDAYLYTVNGGMPRLDPQSHWRFFAPWFYKGIRSFCGRMVDLAHDGKVISVSAKPFIPPKQTSPVLSKEEAVRIADEFREKKLGRPPYKNPVVILTVCLKDEGRLSGDENNRMQSDETYLAWSVEYGDIGFSYVGIKVDAITGEILGWVY